MFQSLFWIVIAYAAGAVIVQAAWRRSGGAWSGVRHYVLYTMNDQRHVEWAVRSLMLVSWLRGQPVAITIVDEGSTDDTLAIVRCLSRRHAVNVRAAAEDEEILIAGQSGEIPGADRAETIHIRLYRPEEMEKLLQGR